MGHSVPTDPRIHQSTDGIAYLVFTSGSTGPPKPVAVSHRSLAVFLSSLIQTLAITAADRVLADSSFGFDASLWEVFGALGAGGAVIVPPEEFQMDPIGGWQYASEHSVTVVHVVPTVGRILPLEVIQGCAHLRLVAFGGEQLTGEVAARFSAPGRLLVNCYGPTEGTIHATYQILDETVDGSEVSLSTPGGMRRGLSIGYAREGANVHVVTRAGSEAKVGGVGELWIGGEAPAVGYWMSPSATAAAFVADPFTSVPGSRAYRTGDIVELGAGGRLRFHGRRDEQVKVRGVRMNLSEVEEALVLVPGVTSAVAFLEKADGLEMLAAVVISDLREDVIRRKLAEVAPSWCIPERIYFRDAFPSSPSGKLNRAAVVADLTGGVSSRGTRNSEYRRSLGAIWQEILELEQAPMDGDFFELGGHSLHAIRLAAQIREQFSVSCTVRTVFTHRTMSDQVGYLSREVGDE
jgi:amino acid adenylation domain-containing protein